MTKSPGSNLKKPTALVGTTVAYLLDQMRPLQAGDRCPRELDVAAATGVSRTTVRNALDHLEQKGVIHRNGATRILARSVRKSDYDKKVSQPVPKDREVVKYLISKVSSGEIQPGDKVSERTIAHEFGCSIAPVREAMLAMGPLGLFRKQSRRQWEAVQLDTEQFAELTELRIVIERYCLQKMFDSGWNKGNKDRLTELLERTTSLFHSKRINLSKFFEVDIAFHHMLLESSRNSLISERNRFIYLIIQFQLSNRRFSQDRARLGLSQHVKILKAVLGDDAATAEALLVQHLEAALETMRQIRSKTG